MTFSVLSKTAIGDAYGAGFEYADEHHVRSNNLLSGYVRNQRHNLKPGFYTDDTQMAMAVAEVIVAGQFSRQALADSFVYCFKRDQREGYARGFYSLLCQVANGTDLLSTIRPHSDKSGAAMRAVPIGIYPDIATVKRLSAMQAAITHDTPDGINAAVAASLMGHYFLYNLGAKKDLGTFLEAHVSGNNCRWASPWSGSVGEKGWMSVQAAVTAIVNHDSLSEILLDCVAFTGDVDTVAAIALGAASASVEVRDDLPPALTDRLENGQFGRDYLTALDARLAQVMQALRIGSQLP